jgi:DNA (cytosine-5)-methyltransferase 1
VIAAQEILVDGFAGITIGSLFSGIGGFELGLERAGLGRVVWQAEIDPFCRAVLAKHWPDATRYSDVKGVGHGAAQVEVICGGFPCQDVSLAGKRGGLDGGTRSGLWGEYARVVEELHPKIVIIENVLGLRTLGLRRVLRDLADLGFDAEWCDLSAWDVGAPHLRRRLFIVATHPDRIDVREQPGWLERACRSQAALHRVIAPEGFAADPDPLRRLEQARELAVIRGWSEHCGWELRDLAPLDDGLSRGVVSRCRKALGNAVVVQCAEVVGRAVMDACGMHPAAREAAP